MCDRSTVKRPRGERAAVERDTQPRLLLAVEHERRPPVGARGIRIAAKRERRGDSRRVGIEIELERDVVDDECGRPVIEPPLRRRRRAPRGSIGFTCVSAVRLLDLEQLDVEDQRGVRRNHAAGAARAVAQSRRNHERALAAHLHAGNAFVPALDHAARAERERERGVAIARAVELRRRANRASTCRTASRCSALQPDWPATASAPVPCLTSIFCRSLCVASNLLSPSAVEVDTPVAIRCASRHQRDEREQSQACAKAARTG